ncbi:GDSL-type esterase/lipase family protein [Pseudofulvibacter geojedonensis]|uniref:GDSL-type esterase/lipase family protein n=1 Tax=Pseudofulvibacter geojedonensis TaxID=1123758 RepID=A0ABW3HZG3_9FLAO
MNKLLLYILILFCFARVSSQNYILDSIQSIYPFIEYQKNQIKFSQDSPAFKALFKKLNAIKNQEKEDLHVFHIGGSHIQADFYSNKLRHYLQHFVPEAKGQRGFVFPYKLAKTNNPLNYRITSEDNWVGYRCSRPDTTSWGMAGVTAKFTDSIAHINVKANFRNYSKNTYNFNKLRVFYNTWNEGYLVKLVNDSLVSSTSINHSRNYIEFKLNKTIDETDICIERLNFDSNSEFLLMGVELMNDNTGVEYTSIGVNGASFAYYNRCNYFEDQLLTYQPDLFIISVGTNDTYTTDFDAEAYKNHYEGFIQLIQRANPNCAILLTVPNDSYYKRKYANPNTQIAAEVIYKLADKYKMGVWDFYEIMGGLGSSQKWYKNKLMPRDRIHFTRLGYSIKADLLLKALVEAWEEEDNVITNEYLNLFKK